MDDNARRRGETVIVTGADAKARFDELVARAGRGDEIVVVEGGQVVARIVAPAADESAAPDDPVADARERAWQETLKLSRAGYRSDGPWTREELHER